MRVARIYTNETCNQNCAFCDRRRPKERRAFVAPAAVAARIESADAETLVLTGGEPTMRRDLETLVAHAKATGARVILETNAALIDGARAEALARAGLDVARVHLPTWGDALDQITRDPGGWARTHAGMAALRDAGVALEASAPVVAENRETLVGLPSALVGSGFGFVALRLGVPCDGPSPSSLLTPSEAAAQVSAVEAACRRQDLLCVLEPDSLIAPCFFERPARVAHLFALTAGGSKRAGYRPLPGCATCRVADRCPGVPEAALAREPTLTVSPILEDRIRRRLSIIDSTAAQIARELTQDDVHHRETGETLPARIVRINFRCNQACHFCFVSTHLPTAADEDVRAAIVDIARRGGALILSGGEPTLNDALVDYVGLGKREGAAFIEVQTNAIALGDPSRVDALLDAGVDDFLVSLHGSRAEISDTITQAPGTFDKTVQGLDTLASRGARVRVNFVFCGYNQGDFPAYVALVAERWPDALIVVSFVAPSTDVVPRKRELIPRYSEILASLAEGMRRGEALGVTISGFESMCGVPLCLVPTELERFTALGEIPEGLDDSEFVKTEACRRCALEDRCFGLRRGYIELYGDDELAPVAR